MASETTGSLPKIISSSQDTSKELPTNVVISESGLKITLTDR